MSIRGLLAEKESIEKELKHLRQKTKTLNKRKKEIEYLFVETLKKNKVDTYNYKNQMYKIEEREKRKRKSEKQKKSDLIQLLKEKYNLPQAEKMSDDLIKTLKGEGHLEYKLKKEHKKKK